METPRFEVGDLVKVKEGSHNMVVLGYQMIPSATKPEEKVICIWFENDKSYRQPFTEDILERIN